MSEEKKIPKHWQIKKLGEVCKILAGYGFPKNIQGSTLGEFPFYKVGDISKNVKSGNRYLKLCDNYIDEKTLLKLKAKPYPKHTIVFAKIGEGLKLNRRAIINTPGIVDNNAVGLKAIENICDDMFLFNFLTTVKLEDYSKATTVPSVRKSEIEGISFPLPPLPEQQAIVAKIEELLSDLENGKQQLQTAQQQLKVYRQSLLKWAFEKSAESVPVKLVDVCDFITKGTTPSKGKLTSNTGEIPFLKVYNLSFDGTLNFSKDSTYVSNETHNVLLKRSKVYPNDVLMNIVGPPLGKVSIVPNTFPEWNINQAMVRFRCQERLLNKYLMYFLLSENTIRTYSRKAKATAGQFNLTLEICRDIEIPLPKILEQLKIVEEIESKLTVCDKIEETISHSLQQAETLRQSILKKAFEGKLVAQNPNDEPASRLLERIKAESEKKKSIK